MIGFQTEQPKIRPKCPTPVTATIGMMWMEPLKHSTSGQSHLVETVLENPGFYQVDLVSWSKAHQYASAHKAVGHARQHFFQNERRLLLVTESGGLRFSRWCLLLTQGMFHNSSVFQDVHDLKRVLRTGFKDVQRLVWELSSERRSIPSL